MKCRALSHSKITVDEILVYVLLYPLLFGFYLQKWMCILHNFCVCICFSFKDAS